MNGMIYTFYSYKGGVGRSMALANLGMYFYKQGYTTLLVDWDLEAPGIERYFEQRFKLDLNEIEERPGLIDMIKTYVNLASQPKHIDNESLYPPIEDYIYTIDKEENSSLMLLHSGRRGKGKLWSEYASFVQNFDWVDFYEAWDGGNYLEWMRERFKQIADIILIDSRTGITEMGGITTQHLADAVLILCGANIENINNNARMAQNFTSDAVKKARNNRQLDVMVIPSRIDDADSEGFGEFLERFSKEFEHIPMHVFDDGYKYIDITIPYLPHFSYKETLVIDNDETEKTAIRLLESYRKIAANIQLLAHEDSTLKYNKISSKQSSQRVFLIYGSQSRSAITPIIEHLERQDIQVQELVSETRQTSQEIQKTMSQSFCVIVFITNTLIHSEYALSLILSAIDIKKPVIPVLLEATEIPYFLNIYHIIDFTIRNKEYSYQQLANTIMQFEFKKISAEKQIEKERGLIYISHSTMDDPTVSRISTALRKKGFNSWVDHENMQPGDNWTNAIQDALNDASIMILVLSRRSILSAEITSEWRYFLNLNKPIIPVVVENIPINEIPFRLVTFQFLHLEVDFDRGIDLLIKTLKEINSN